MKEKTPAELHIELRAQRDAFVTKFATALMAAGFAVESVLPAQDWLDGTLSITSDKTAEFENTARFEMLGHRGWSTSQPKGIRLVYRVGTGYRTLKTRYTKLTDDLISKLVAGAVNNLTVVLWSIEIRKQQHKDEASWAVVRQQELAGQVMPPGMSVNIVPGNGKLASRYMIRFEAGSVASVYMTKEQVIKLMALLNEIQDTANKFVVVRQQRDGPTLFWDGYWSTSTKRLFDTEDAAFGAMKTATNATGEALTNIRVVSYASVAAI